MDTQLANLLTPETVLVGLQAASKLEALDTLIDLVGAHPAVVDLDMVKQDVLDRESIMSTGVGQGLALPHAKTSGVTETIAAFAIAKNPVDYGAIDQQPVRLLFLLLGPEDARSQHIKTLSRISRLMNRAHIRNALMEAADASEVLEILDGGEMELLDR